MAGGGRGDGQGEVGGDLIGPNPTDRGKAGTKRSVLVDGDGGPLAVVVAGANINDFKLLKDTMEAIVVERPESRQHLCLDRGYDNAYGRLQPLYHGYEPHIRRIGEEKLDSKHHKTRKARRWVVERTIGWLSKCRSILVRYEKKAANYLGLVHLACALIWFRRYYRLTVSG
jgi:putative transposase